MEFLGLDIHSQVSGVIVKVKLTILGKRVACFKSSGFGYSIRNVAQGYSFILCACPDMFQDDMEPFQWQVFTIFFIHSLKLEK